MDLHTENVTHKTIKVCYTNTEQSKPKNQHSHTATNIRVDLLKDVRDREIK